MSYYDVKLVSLTLVFHEYRRNTILGPILLVEDDSKSVLYKNHGNHKLSNSPKTLALKAAELSFTSHIVQI